MQDRCSSAAISGGMLRSRWELSFDTGVFTSPDGCTAAEQNARKPTAPRKNQQYLTLGEFTICNIFLHPDLFLLVCISRSTETLNIPCVAAIRSRDHECPQAIPRLAQLPLHINGLLNSEYEREVRITSVTWHDIGTRKTFFLFFVVHSAFPTGLHQLGSARAGHEALESRKQNVNSG